MVFADPAVVLGVLRLGRSSLFVHLLCGSRLVPSYDDYTPRSAILGQNSLQFCWYVFGLSAVAGFVNLEEGNGKPQDQVRIT